VATIRLDAFRASARARSQARLLLPDVRTLGRARPRAANRTGGSFARPSCPRAATAPYNP